MSEKIEISWRKTMDRFESSVEGVALAERLIESLASDPEFYFRKDILDIFTNISESGKLQTEAAKGFLAKINFALKTHAFRKS